MKIKVNDVNEASWRDMQVKSNLPENLRKLEEIAYNLWWCWDSDARNLFRNIDRTAWKEASSNPIRLASVLPYKKLLELSEDKQFLERLDPKGWSSDTDKTVAVIECSPLVPFRFIAT